MTETIEPVAPPVIYRGGALEGKLVTHHEMGHVIACLEYDIPFDKVKVETGFFTPFTGAGYVRTTQDWDENWNSEKIDQELIVYLAGRAAEERWLELNPGHSSVRAESMYSDFRVVKYVMATWKSSSLPVLRAQAAQLVQLRWPQIAAGAVVLEHRKAMNARAAARATKVKS